MRLIHYFQSSHGRLWTALGLAVLLGVAVGTTTGLVLRGSADTVIVDPVRGRAPEPGPQRPAAP